MFVNIAFNKEKMSIKRVVVIGATSGIGKGLAIKYAENGYVVGITGRREDRLKEIAIRSPKSYIYRVCDVTKPAECIPQIEELVKELGGVDIVIITAGAGELNPHLEYKLEEPSILTNVVGFTSIVDWAMNRFESQKQGHLISISSVGGIRGSAGAPAYSASKAYQMNYLEGMHQKATKLKLPIYVTDIRPGFVDTAMAKGDGIFWVAPIEKATTQIYNAIQRKKRVAYISKRWRYIAFVLRILPPFIYSKM